MFKLNKKGFALVETLIVSVFVATVFTIMYTNFFPMFGEYERRERYDDVDSIYRTFVLKRTFENPYFRKGKEDTYNGYKETLKSNSFVRVFNVKYEDESNGTLLSNETIESSIATACSTIASTETTWNNYCKTIAHDTKVSEIYLTKYNITDLKTEIKKGNITDISVEMQDYIDSLPYYKNNSTDCQYRIIVKFAKEINAESENFSKVVYSFSTMGVVI